VNVVVSATPFTLMAVVGTKPVPATVMTAGAAPVSSVMGDIDAIVGEGLSTSRLIVVPEPLLDDPFDTTTCICAPLVNWLAGTVTVSCVALT
jgi:hypothetical protein